eukprot:COSAG04_NODE_1874_length_5336_cov_1.751193_6_plen_105_part_00
MHSQAMPTLDINYKNEQVEVAQMVNKISSHPSVVRYGWGNEYCQRPNCRGLSCTPGFGVGLCCVLSVRTKAKPVGIACLLPSANESRTGNTLAVTLAASLAVGR